MNVSRAWVREQAAKRTQEAVAATLPVTEGWSGGALTVFVQGRPRHFKGSLGKGKVGHTQRWREKTADAFLRSRRDCREQAVTPAHQWTHDGAKVRLLKCVAADGTSYDGFRWPEAGAVICPRAERDRAKASAPTCESGGLFGWPWGIGMGGKEPVYLGARWIVFEADPADVVLGAHNKSKVIGPAEVIFSGPWWLAWTRVLDGSPFAARLIVNADPCQTLRVVAR